MNYKYEVIPGITKTAFLGAAMGGIARGAGRLMRSPAVKNIGQGAQKAVQGARQMGSQFMGAGITPAAQKMTRSGMKQVGKGLGQAGRGIVNYTQKNPMGAMAAAGALGGATGAGIGALQDVQPGNSRMGNMARGAMFGPVFGTLMNRGTI